MIVGPWGLVFPCNLQDFIFAQTMTAYVLILPIRSLQLIVIFDPVVGGARRRRRRRRIGSSGDDDDGDDDEA